MGEPTAAESNLRTYLAVFRRRYPWIIIVAVFAVVVSLGLSAVQHKKYTASAQLLVQPAGSASSLSSTNQQAISPTDILTELQLLTSAPVFTKATSQLGFQPSIAGSEVGQSNVILVTATAGTPALAARAANTYAKDFVAQQRSSAINAIISGEKQYESQINTLNSQIEALGASASTTAATRISALASQVAVLKGDEAQLQVSSSLSPGGVELVSHATAPFGPSSPRPKKEAVIALVIGVILGLALALLVDFLDDRVYTKEALEKLTGALPVLAVIPRVKNWRAPGQSKTVALDDPYSPISESYRSLRAALLLAGRDGDHTRILVTSAGWNEGKTSAVANLGVVMANAGKRVLVVSGDFRRPRLGDFLGLRELPGLTSILVGQESLAGATKSLPEISGLSFIGTGPIPSNAAELLGSSAAARLFDVVARQFDVVLIDSPPLMVSDALVLSSYADALLLVVAAGETKKKSVQQALQQLGRTSALPAGIVLNKVTQRTDLVGENQYGSDYGDADLEQSPSGSDARWAPNGKAQNGKADHPKPQRRDEEEVNS
jgi:succinoglycan biosynthesis transport protein ExoP